jgi:hypothetical protein
MPDVNRGSRGVSLAQLVEVLGPAILRVLATPGLDAVFARDLVVYDVVDPPVLRPGDIVLGVGLRADSDAACEVVEAAAAANAAAVVVRSGGGELPLLRKTAERVRSTLMVLPAGMRWEQISVLMRHAIAATTSGGEGLMAVGDLFGFANMLARAVGGAVTVEDAGSHVLAYSTLDEDELDVPRREAILGRRVPETYLEHLRERGVSDALRSSEEVVHLDADERLGLRRRLAISVRANEEVLGTLWALEGRIPLGAEAERVLRDAARVAPGHLIRAQNIGATLRQRREDLLRQMLEDTVEVRTAADALGFDADLPAAVIGVALDSRGDLSTDQHAFRRLDELINTRAMAFRWHVASVLTGARMLVLLPELTGERDHVEMGIRRVATGFVTDARQAGLGIRVACGPVMDQLAEVASTTTIVEEILQCLAREPQRGALATFEQVRAALAVENAVRALDPVTSLWDGPVKVLLQHDAERGTEYRMTLRVWLDAFGDTAVAAAKLNIHRNTLRYRIQRISDLSGIRLGDPDERLIASLHLRRVAPSRGVIH